jgi:putative oxidoreductase
MFTTFSKNVLVPLLLRLALAVIFIYHGLDKVWSDGNQGGANWYKAPDAPPGVVQLVIAWGELLGGAALGLGFLTRLAALGIIAIMIGAIVTVTWQNGFDNTKHGFEYNFAIIVMCVCLVLSGPGPIAVDRVFRFKRKET